ncbi:MAG: IS630 family transposase [Verrucomicrobiota bacterium]
MKCYWCIGKLNAEFLARMEQILWLYDQPYDPDYPVVCFDERPCFLIGDTVEPIPMKRGKVKKEHYAYEKKGSCSLLAAIEPLTGKRIAKVFDQRRKIEYAQFMKQIAQAYPDASKIRIVQDNLNTHTISAFYQVFAAQEAFELAKRFEFFFTPKSASWPDKSASKFDVTWG